MADVPVGYYTPEQAKEIWETVKLLRSSGLLRNRKPVSAPRQDEHLVWVENTSGEVVPPFACMQIVTSTHSDYRTYIQITKPTATVGEFIFNGEFPIPVAGRGACLPWGVVRMQGNGDLAPLSNYRAVPDTWTIEPGGGPFVVFGPDETRSNVLIGRFGGTNVIRIRFITTEAISGQTVQARVLKTEGNPISLDTGDPLEPGDEITVTDSYNLFGDIEEKCIGWAYFAQAESEILPARYEIEDCSMPVDELKVELIECLKSTDATLTVRYTPHKTRSSYNNAGEPPELNESEEIENVQNPSKLDGCPDSPCIIKRVTNKHFSTEDAVIGAGSATEKHWELVSVEKRKARYIIISYSTGDGSTVEESFSVVHYWEGENPEECCDPVELFNPWDIQCELFDTLIMCHYRPEHDDYVMGTTAPLGPLILGEFVDGAIVGDQRALRWDETECGAITYRAKKFAYFRCCEEGCITTVTQSWPGTVTPVITGVSISGDVSGYTDQECLVFTRGYALVCDTTYADPIYLCGTPCCTEQIYYKILTAGDPLPDGSTDVGGYADESEISKYVAEKCIAEDGDKTGWTLGAGESIPTGTFTRTDPSPTCCPEA